MSGVLILTLLLERKVGECTEPSKKPMLANMIKVSRKVLLFAFLIQLFPNYFDYRTCNSGFSGLYVGLHELAALQRNKKLIIPRPSRVRKIHTSNAKEMYEKGQPEPKGEPAEERTASQVNSLVSMTMADKMDES